MSSDTPLSRWLRTEMPRRGYPIGGPRSGGVSRLAEDAGISQATMSRLYHGQGKPEVDTLRKLAPIFGKTLGEMIVIAGLAEVDELADTASKPQPVELQLVEHDRVNVEVSIDPDLSISEAIRIVEEADGRPLSREERILVNTLELMEYPPDEVAGMVVVSRRLADRRAEQDAGRTRKRA